MEPDDLLWSRNERSQKDLEGATAPLRQRVVWAEIDREAQKGKPLPSDHAPLVIDTNSPSHPFDAGWASGDSRIAARLRDQRCATGSSG